MYFVGSLFKCKGSDVNQKEVEILFIEWFFYLKYGFGQFWEEVVWQVVENGGEVCMYSMCMGLCCNGKGVCVIEVIEGGDVLKIYEFEGDYFFLMMLMKDFVCVMDIEVLSEVQEVSEGLIYCDFIIVGVFVEKFEIGDLKIGYLKDNWIYMQELDVKVGCFQIFNNWSFYMVVLFDILWVGFEYFCNEGDDFWEFSDDEFKKLVVEEFLCVDIFDMFKVFDQVVICVLKIYLVYFGSYECFLVLCEWVDGFENFFFVGCNGMYKYNNQDYLMLMVMFVVENICDG